MAIAFAISSQSSRFIPVGFNSVHAARSRPLVDFERCRPEAKRGLKRDSRSQIEFGNESVNDSNQCGSAERVGAVDLNRPRVVRVNRPTSHLQRRAKVGSQPLGELD